MPALVEWVRLDEKAYRTKICRPHYSDKALGDNIYQKRREINAAGWTIGANFALIPITMGASALAIPVAGRSLQIAHQKLGMLESEWRRRGYPTLPTHFVRDGVVPCVVAGTVGAVTMGIDNGFAAAGLSAMNHSAVAGGNHLAGAALNGNSMAPGTGHQFLYGAGNGIHQGFAVLEHHGYSQLATANPYAAPAFTVGQAAGVNAVHQGVDYATQKFGNWAQDQVVRRS